MKILFDCTFLRNRQTGVDVCFLILIKSLLKIDNQNHYIILIDHRFDTNNLKKDLEGYSNYKIVRIFCYYPLSIFISAFIIPFYMLFKGINVYHNPYFFGPLLKLSKTKVIITIHDLYHRQIPEKMNRFHNFLMLRFADPAIRLADKLIVISTQTKLDAIKYYHLPESKLALIYQSFDELYHVDSQDFSLLGLKNNIQSQQFILNVGKILPSKGIDDLINAYSILLKNHPDLSNIKLVFAGISETKYFAEMEHLIQELNLPLNNILFLGYITKGELIGLYKNAALYVLPSYYEGFGLTALEAMKYNCPVIARNASSLPEVVDTAGLLFNNTEELANNMYSLLTDNGLKTDLISRGVVQANKFSPAELARKTLAVYN